MEDDYGLAETHLVLSMMNLFPTEIVEKLTAQFGGRFSALPETKRLALCLAEHEGGVTNRQLQKLSDEHGRDITNILRDLVSEGFLEPYGEGQGRKYSVSQVPQKQLIAEASNISSEHKALDSEQTNTKVVTLAEQVRTKQRASRDLVVKAILELCSTPSTVDSISKALGRTSDTIRVHYLSKMVAEGSLVLVYPDQPNHPKQAYKTP